MKVNFNDVLYALSYGLDCVEREIVSVSSHHAKRVAYISVVLGKFYGLGEMELLDLAACGILHDCAVSEYLQAEKGKEELNSSTNEVLKIHCAIGEENVRDLPFSGNVEGAILYHHENADGSGPYGKKTEEVPLFARLIHFSDILDVNCDLGSFGEEKYAVVKEYLEKCRGTIFEEDMIELFYKAFTKQSLEEMKGEEITTLLKSILPQRELEQGELVLYGLANLFAKIIDYKSEFTSLHSIGIAKKAWKMAEFYGYDDEMKSKLYFAGALHDIGKLVITNDVLEKPGKLDDKEYRYIQSHVWYTHEILSQIQGMEDIHRWASRHHEKLDGNGYPFGMAGETLDHNDRLIACLDIYQALSEPRSYKEGMSHPEVMKILREMARQNQLDREIVEDIDIVFKRI